MGGAGPTSVAITQAIPLDTTILGLDFYAQLAVITGLLQIQMVDPAYELTLGW